VPLANGTLKVIINIAALANTGAVANVEIRSRLRFTPENGMFCELKQDVRKECILVGWINIVVNE
jgi:hypothetical protein